MPDSDSPFAEGCQLLISLRNLQELQVAVRYPIDLLDFKEPAAGGLGLLNRRLLEPMLDVVPHGQRLSLAMGELSDWMPAGDVLGDWQGLRPLLRRFDFVKIGLSDAIEFSRVWGVAWQEAWQRFRRDLPAGVTLVGVLYADNRLCRSPGFASMVDLLSVADEHQTTESDKSDCKTGTLNPIGAAAIHQQPRVLLIDTQNKTSGSTIDHLGWDGLRNIAQQCRERQIRLAIAGSLKLTDLPKLLELRPSWIGFRGGVCRQGRDTLDETKLASLISRWPSRS